MSRVGTKISLHITHVHAIDVLHTVYQQGHHNVKDAHGKSALHIFDAHLTAQGEGEARAIGEPGGALASVASVASAAAAPPQVAFISPLWRTMQTADLALAGLKSVPRFALEDAREGNNNCGCNHRHKLGDTHKALGMTHREACLTTLSLLRPTGNLQ